MTKQEQKQFIKAHIKAIEIKILSKILPESWEGLELKQYISDSFLIPKHWFKRKDKANYNNDIIINNL
jgi:hypothetical protein